jgi:hypothetical protein
MTTMMSTRSTPAESVAFGEKLGLYEAISRCGPVTSRELANISGVPEHHLTHWLEIQVANEFIVKGVDTARYQTWCDIPRN